MVIPNYIAAFELQGWHRAPYGLELRNVLLQAAILLMRLFLGVKTKGAKPTPSVFRHLGSPHPKERQPAPFRAWLTSVLDAIKIS
jgi:hypothetical protein